ncbi:MAG: type II secretion system F family protein [Nanoarchaeota archaeon]
MLSKPEDIFLDLKKNISREMKIAREIMVFSDEIEKAENSNEKKEIVDELNSLKKEIKKTGDNVSKLLNQIETPNPFSNYSSLKVPEVKMEESPSDKKNKPSFSEKISQRISDRKYKSNLPNLDKDTLKRLKKKDEEEKITKGKIKKPSIFVRKANQMFSEFSFNLIKKGSFKEMQSDLIKSNLNILLKSYVSMILLSTLISFAASFVLFLFLLLFDVTAFPTITLASGNFGLRFLKTFWIIFLVPIGTFLFMFFYPSMEKDSVERRINQELPFATINMAAVSGSMIDPTKIFQIMISTKEYPYLEKEFTKLLNSINVLGQDFVTALKNSAFNTSSKKLGELYSGLATTINSGGDLPKFFEERAQTMLFEYTLEKEKNTKTAETFMDIYISVVIAAPMILMLLLMMMRISGLGIALSTTAITTIMVLGVVGINIVFLTFLQIKQPNV